MARGLEKVVNAVKSIVKSPKKIIAGGIIGGMLLTYLPRISFSEGEKYDMQLNNSRLSPDEKFLKIPLKTLKFGGVYQKHEETDIGAEGIYLAKKDDCKGIAWSTPSGNDAYGAKSAQRESDCRSYCYAGDGPDSNDRIIAERECAVKYESTPAREAWDLMIGIIVIGGIAMVLSEI